MSRSKSLSLRVPQGILEACQELSREEYQSLNELVVGLMRYALATHKPHTLTAAIARLPLPEQDKIDDEIVRIFRSGEAHKGQYFERVMTSAVEHVAAGQDIPKDRLARELLRVLTTSAKPEEK